MKKHFYYYLTLSLIFLIAILLLATFSYSKQLQMVWLVVTAFFYVGLGILHHGLHHTITAKIMIEYVAIAALGLSIMLFLLQAVI